MLPVLNEECVRQAIKTGLGLNAKINKHSVFSRKNYFYADLPQGYQITQFEYPIVGEGIVSIDLEDGSTKDVRIERMHIEQDTGKSLHDMSPTKSFIDFNRAGVGLMEIVTRPDFSSSEEAGAFLKKLRSILRYLGTCDGNMDEGSMRCDASVSVRKTGETGFRPRAEIKNVNSVKFVMQAIDAEARRQIEVYENGDYAGVIATFPNPYKELSEALLKEIDRVRELKAKGIKPEPKDWSEFYENR
jgi:aspartyl-tRNA(Asn)/glutamyl-tRNA(Gln) amidotransferase subunit B